MTSKTLNGMKDDSSTEIKNNIEDNVLSIDSELRQFIDLISSLSSTLSLSMDAITTAYLKTIKEIKAFEKDNVIHKNEDGKEIILVKVESSQKFDDLHKQRRLYGLAFETIPNSYIMSLISQYDAFLGRLLKIIFLVKPEILNSSDKSLTFSQLSEFNSLDEAKEYILEKKIETLIRDSHLEQIQSIENLLKVPLRKGLDIFPKFIEITERRNLFVHTGGEISNQYIRVCKDNNILFEGAKVGDILTVTPEYFAGAFDIVYELGFKLAHVLWRKFIPQELEVADRNLIDIGYDTLYSENYQLTKIIFDFATQTLKKHHCEENRRIMIVNRALAYKWSGNNNKALEIIKSEDWTATSIRFRLAEAVILENYKNAYEIMKEIGSNSAEVSTEKYRGWPLFKQIKKESSFIKLFEKIFNEPFYKIEKEDMDQHTSLISDSGITV
jgi:hypothetical protein